MQDAAFTVCPWCAAPSYRRVPQAPTFFFAGGDHTRYVNGSIRLRREAVTQNRDGSETVYGSVAEAERGELERTGNPRLAQKNAQVLLRGLVPGTERATFQAACDEPRR
jgi:predicted nucleic acid-binding Zn ribbon protein